MKRLMCLCLFLFLIVFITAAVNAQNFTKSMLQYVEMTTDFDNPVNTFEDVTPITGIRAQFSDTGPFINKATIDSKLCEFGNFAKKAAADNFFNKLNLYSGLIYSETEPDFSSFLASHFYLDAGHEKIYDDGRPRSWHSVFSYPRQDLTFSNYGNTTNPHGRVYSYCIRSSFKYIQPFPQPPLNSVSCEDCRPLCNYPPCVRKKVGEDPASAGVMITLQEEKHEQTEPNIYKDLKSMITLLDAPKLVEKESGIGFTMTFKDRTPPRIEGCVDGDFPELGAVKPATSGDWFKVEGLKIIDNSGGKVGTALLLGKIDTSPVSVWADEEKWILEKPRVVQSGAETDQVIMPNSCHGAMRYTMYAWDSSGNVNPGDPNIIEDAPKLCYGLGNTVVGNSNVDFDGNWIDKDLDVDPRQARGWPIKVEFRKEEFFDGPYIKSLENKLNSNFRRGQGFVNIEDNDLPNIVIRLESVKDGSRIFFPPVIPDGDPDFSIMPSKHYKSGSGPGDKNVSDYTDFLGPTTEIPYLTSKIADGSQEMYFRIVDIFPSRVMAVSDQDLLFNKYIRQPDPEFIRKHFRLESYDQSDTREADGKPDLDVETFGKRNSFGRRVVAVLETPDHKGLIQEDVEYLIDVWTDDNIKWATIDASGQKLDSVVSIPSGIRDGEMVVEIPNQYPRASYRVPIGEQDSVNGKLRVVFREPTPTDVVGANDIELSSKKFPYIEVKVTDYAGFERSIKLFLRITNENPNIRVLDRKHEQNR